MADRRGFTLIETLFSSLILLTVATAVAGVLIHSAYTRHRAHQRTLGVYLAYEKLEEVRQSTFAPGLSSQELHPQSTPSETYIQMWELSEGESPRVTVAVWARGPGGAYRKVAALTASAGDSP